MIFIRSVTFVSGLSSGKTRNQFYRETLHLLYHLYNYEQFRVLLPQGTSIVLEALQEIKEALVLDQDCETALDILQELDQRFRGGLENPTFEISD